MTDEVPEQPRRRRTRQPRATDPADDELFADTGAALVAELEEDAAIERRAVEAFLAAELERAPIEATARSVRRFDVANLVRAIIAAGAGAVFAFVTNVYILAAKYDGYNVIPGAAGAGKGNRLWGATYWFALTSVMAYVLSYWISVGNDRFAATIRNAPATVRDFLVGDGASVGAHVLVGFAVAMVVLTKVSGPVAIVGAIGTFVLLVSIARVVIAVVSRIARTVWERLRPEAAPPSRLAVARAVVGVGAAFLVAYVVDGTAARLVLAILAAGGAFVLLRGTPQASTSTPLIVIVTMTVAMAALLALAPTAPARADDGGWQECGAKFSAWAKCGGTSKVFEESLLAAIAGLLGAGLGAVLGGAAGAVEGDGDGDGEGGEGGGSGGTSGEGPTVPTPEPSLFDEFYSGEESQKRSKLYAKEWRQQGGDPTDPAYEEYAHKRDALEWTRAAYDRWRRDHPDGDPAAFLRSGRLPDGSGSGAVVDVSQETLDALSLTGSAIKFGPALVKGGAKLATSGAKALRTEIDIAVEALKSRRVTAASRKAFAAEVKAEMKVYEKMNANLVTQYYRSLEKVVEKYGPDAADRFIDVTLESESMQKAFYQKTLNEVLVGNRPSAAKNLLLEAFEARGLPTKWATESAQAIASGLTKPAWVGDMTVTELRKFANMFLEGQGRLLSNPPSADALVKTWSAMQK